MADSITYYTSDGKQHTGETLRIARERSCQLGIRKVLVASSHGFTALQAAEMFAGQECELTAVTISPSFEDMGWVMTEEERAQVEAAGVHILTCLHGLADGTAEGFYGQHTPGTVVADTLRMFSQGMKVAVEIAVMAAEAGLVTPQEEVLSIAGTNEGCDTAIILRPAYARKINEIRILEILCKPRLA